VDVEFDDSVTDPEALASAADRLMETALSTPGIMEEYGDPRFGEFFVAKADGNRPKPGPTVVVEVAGGVLQEAYSPDSAVRLVLVDWDTESGTAGDDGIVTIIGKGRRSRLALVTEFPTVPVDQMGKDTGQALRAAGIECQQARQGRRRWVLYDLASGALLGTRVYNDRAEAVEGAAQADDVLVLPLAIPR
jgi:hypothetical protein